MMLRYTKTEQSEPIYTGFSATGLSLSSYWYAQDKSLETLVGQWTAEWTPTFSTEVKVSSRDYDSVPKNNAYLPAIGLQFTGALPAGAPAGLATGSRFLNFGTEQSRQNNVLGTKTKDFYAAGTWSLGDHEVKFGSDFSKNDVYNAFLQNVNGNYTFGCINSSATFALFVWRDQLRHRHRGRSLQAAVLENFNRGRPSSYSVQVPQPGRTLDDAIATFSLKNIGLFAARYLERQQAADRQRRRACRRHPHRRSADPQCRKPHCRRWRAPRRPVVRPVVSASTTTHTIDGENLYQPRVGFNYKFESARPTQIARWFRPVPGRGRQRLAGQSLPEYRRGNAKHQLRPRRLVPARPPMASSIRIRPSSRPI